VVEVYLTLYAADGTLLVDDGRWVLPGVPREGDTLKWDMATGTVAHLKVTEVVWDLMGSRVEVYATHNTARRADA
jgi:hypothetical protein